MLNQVIVITILIVLYHLIQKDNKPQVEKLNLDRVFYNPPVESNKITFDYGNKTIEEQFIKEQEKGRVLNTWYPNTWLDNYDGKRNPIYKSRDNNELVDSKIRFSYDFDKLKIDNYDGVELNNKSIREIYDNSIIDYKKYTPKKKLIDDKSNNLLEGASNLSYLTPDKWVYQEEAPENGGEISSGLYANDNSIINPPAIF